MDIVTNKYEWYQTEESFTFPKGIFNLSNKLNLTLLVM